MKEIQCKECTLGSGIPKTCVAIIEKISENILKTLQSYRLLEMDIIELRADYFEGLQDLTKCQELFENINQLDYPKPIIFTIRTKQEGGQISISSLEYHKIIELACKQPCFDLIDVEYSSKEAKQIIQTCNLYNKITIASSHDFVQTPPVTSLISKMQEMEEIGASIVKVAVMPTSRSDVIGLIEASATASTLLSCPIITMSMGQLGQVTRIAGSLTGSCLTFVTVEKASAPGQMELMKVRSILKSLHNK